MCKFIIGYVNKVIQNYKRQQHVSFIYSTRENYWLEMLYNMLLINYIESEII